MWGSKRIRGGLKSSFALIIDFNQTVFRLGDAEGPETETVIFSATGRTQKERKIFPFITDY